MKLIDIIGISAILLITLLGALNGNLILTVLGVVFLVIVASISYVRSKTRQKKIDTTRNSSKSSFQIIVEICCGLAINLIIWIIFSAINLSWKDTALNSGFGALIMAPAYYVLFLVLTFAPIALIFIGIKREKYYFALSLSLPIVIFFGYLATQNNLFNTLEMIFSKIILWKI